MARRRGRDDRPNGYEFRDLFVVFECHLRPLYLQNDSSSPESQENQQDQDEESQTTIRFRLTEAQKKRVAWIAVMMCYCLNSLLAPRMEGFVGHARLNGDPQLILKFLLRKKRRNPNGFLRGVSIEQVKMTLEGRTAMAHNFVRSIHVKWEKYFEAWIRLSKAMGAFKTAGKISRVFLKLQQSARPDKAWRVFQL